MLINKKKLKNLKKLKTFNFFYRYDFAICLNEWTLDKQNKLLKIFPSSEMKIFLIKIRVLCKFFFEPLPLHLNFSKGIFLLLGFPNLLHLKIFLIYLLKNLNYFNPVLFFLKQKHFNLKKEERLDLKFFTLYYAISLYKNYLLSGLLIKKEILKTIWLITFMFEQKLIFKLVSLNS